MISDGRAGGAISGTTNMKAVKHSTLLIITRLILSKPQKHFSFHIIWITRPRLFTFGSRTDQKCGSAERYQPSCRSKEMKRMLLDLEMKIYLAGGSAQEKEISAS